MNVIRGILPGGEPIYRGYPRPEDEAEPLWVMITTRNTQEPDAPSDIRRINYHNDRSRKWLIKHQYWCLHNGRTVMVHVDGE